MTCGTWALRTAAPPSPEHSTRLGSRCCAPLIWSSATHPRPASARGATPSKLSRRAACARRVTPSLFSCRWCARSAWVLASAPSSSSSMTFSSSPHPSSSWKSSSSGTDTFLGALYRFSLSPLLQYRGFNPDFFMLVCSDVVAILRKRSGSAFSNIINWTRHFCTLKRSK